MNKCYSLLKKHKIATSSMKAVTSMSYMLKQLATDSPYS